eukprot:jgi/Tetstr1/432978/TSEL_022315.t1
MSDFLEECVEEYGLKPTCGGNEPICDHEVLVRERVEDSILKECPPDEIPKKMENVKQTLLRIMQHGLQTKFGLIAISFTLGGDLAFVTEFYEHERHLPKNKNLYYKIFLGVHKGHRHGEAAHLPIDPWKAVPD